MAITMERRKDDNEADSLGLPELPVDIPGLWAPEPDAGTVGVAERRSRSDMGLLQE